ncbi:MAG: hypothetical protein RI957_14 [Verrucomicrobiota bacterium]
MRWHGIVKIFAWVLGIQLPTTSAAGRSKVTIIDTPSALSSAPCPKISDRMKTHSLLGAALAAVALTILPAEAASVTASAAAPVIDGEDIANLGTQITTDKWWP